MNEKHDTKDELSFITGINQYLGDVFNTKIVYGYVQVKDTNIDLDDDKYKDIKGVIVREFSLETLKFYINLQRDIDIIFVLPVLLSNEQKEYLYENESKLNRVSFLANKNQKYTIADMKKLDEAMDLMVKDIKESNLSPYERYTAVYDIVKSFKSYKDSDKGKEAPRSVYSFILSEYAVCVGYTNFFIELLSRLSIKSDSLSCNGWKDEHSITITHIVDDKYGIDSFQLADPTADAIKDDYKQEPLIEKYTFLNFTFKEAIARYSDVATAPFFYEKDANKMLEYIQGKFGKSYTSITFNKYANELLNLMQEELSKQYGQERIKPWEHYKNDEPLNIFKDLLKEIGEDTTKYDLETAKKVISYIQEKMDKDISYEKKLMAIFNVNKHVYGELNYADFICENFTVKKQFMVPFDAKNNEESLAAIDNFTMKSIIICIKSFLKKYYSLEFINNITDPEIIMHFQTAVLLEEVLVENGIVIWNDRLMIGNSILRKDANLQEIAQSSDVLEYDSEMNNLFIRITPDINNMSFKEFKEYLEKTIEEYRVNKQY